MIHATVDGFVSSPQDYYGERKFATVRLGLTDDQCEALCECMAKELLLWHPPVVGGVKRSGPAGESNGNQPSDILYTKVSTFGTHEDPGMEVGTLLIMECLDSIGVDREALGLGGFVSSDDIAQ